MKIIFTDIDGVLNPDLKIRWNQKCVSVYNKICEDFDLHPVITSTWRLQKDMPKLLFLLHHQWNFQVSL